MTIKSIPSGDVIKYILGPRDYKGLVRPFAPELVGSSLPKVSQAYLRRLAAPHVRKQRRYWLPHYRQQTKHLITGFTEPAEILRPLLPLINRSTECLIAAGLPLDSLQPVWALHPTEHSTHEHAALLLQLFPGAGRLDSPLPQGLVKDFAWLVSRKLNLSNPVQSTRFRLLSAGRISYKTPAARERLDMICQQAHAAYPREFGTHDEFLAWFKRKFPDIAVLASPNARGATRPAPGVKLDQVYRGCLGIAGPAGEVLWLKGELCRKPFNVADFTRDLTERQARFADAEKVYQRFVVGVNRRYENHRAAYGPRFGEAAAARAITPDYFRWLQPAFPLTRDSLQTLPISRELELPALPVPATPRPQLPEPPAGLPGDAYPYYDDLNCHVGQLLPAQPAEVDCPDLESAADAQEQELAAFWPLLAMAAPPAPPATSPAPSPVTLVRPPATEPTGGFERKDGLAAERPKAEARLSPPPATPAATTIPSAPTPSGNPPSVPVEILPAKTKAITPLGQFLPPAGPRADTGAPTIAAKPAPAATPPPNPPVSVRPLVAPTAPRGRRPRPRPRKQMGLEICNQQLWQAQLLTISNSFDIS